MCLFAGAAKLVVSEAGVPRGYYSRVSQPESL